VVFIGLCCCVTVFCRRATPATVNSTLPKTFCCRCCHCTETGCLMFASVLHELSPNTRHSSVSITCCIVYTGRAKKSNPLGKIRYLRNCSKFFHPIYRVYRGGFRPHILQISLEYLVAFENYNYLNLSVHFSK